MIMHPLQPFTTVYETSRAKRLRRMRRQKINAGVIAGLWLGLFVWAIWTIVQI